MRKPADARSAGILLHPTSLPGRYGIGDFGPEADRFLDWAAAAGLTLWQVLPLCPIGGGGSPYTCPSAFAGNSLLISPELLAREGWLPGETLANVPEFAPDRVDFDGVAFWKDAVLRRSWQHFLDHAGSAAREELDAFRRAPEQTGWLEDWALFAALKKDFGGRAWSGWDEDLARRDPDALRRASVAVDAEVQYQRYLQFLFFRQWGRLPPGSALPGNSGSRRHAHLRRLR